MTVANYALLREVMQDEDWRKVDRGECPECHAKISRGFKRHLEYQHPAHPALERLERQRRSIEWTEKALCAGYQDDTFFPERNSDNRNDVLTPAECRAKSLCVRCPVRRDCLRQGMTEEDGIWGGTLKTERIRFRRNNISVDNILDIMDDQAVQHGLAPAKATNGGRV